MADVSRNCRGFHFVAWGSGPIVLGQESGLSGLGVVWQRQESGLGVRRVLGVAYVRFIGVGGGLDG